MSRSQQSSRIRKYLVLLLAFAILFTAFQGAYSIAYKVTIQSVSYPAKVHPNERFSVKIVFVSNDINGWAKTKLYWEGQELKVSDGVWYGLLGNDVGKNATLTLSDIALAPKVEPYNLEIVMFWKPISPFEGESRQESRSLGITVVNVALSADCLPNSVNANQNFTLQCSITNNGNDVAYDVSAAIVNYGDFTPEGTLHGQIGNLAPGYSKQVSFNMEAPVIVLGGIHKMTLYVSCRDFANKETATNQELSIKVDLSPVDAATTWWPVVILVVVVIVILAFAMVARSLTVGPKGVVLER